MRDTNSRVKTVQVSVNKAKRIQALIDRRGKSPIIISNKDGTRYKLSCIWGLGEFDEPTNGICFVWFKKEEIAKSMPRAA